MTALPAPRARVPLINALRAAARGLTAARRRRAPDKAGTPAMPLRITRADSINWSQAVDGGSRRPRSRSAAPWRG